jgi:DNA-binding HxlR family transcriptional regulator
MGKTLGKDAACPIARSLEVVGERWTFLVLREAFLGRTRFTEFRERLGVSPDVLTARLATLVEFGVLERHTYRDEGAREREEYRLTESGRDLMPVLGALSQWSNEHRPTGAPPTISYATADGEPLTVTFTRPDGTEVGLDEVEFVRSRPVAA